MTRDDFITSVQATDFLSAERKQQLIDNVDWMSADECRFVLKSLEQTKTQLAANEQSVLDEAQKLYDAVKEFEHEELPKLMKAKESGEHAAEDEQAEKLLKDL